MTISPALVRDVLGRDHPRTLLLFLSDRHEPLRYSEARTLVGLRPAEFQRALERLTGHGLVFARARSKLDRPHAERRHHVTLEASALGRFYAELWRRLDRQAEDLARERGIPLRALRAVG